MVKIHKLQLQLHASRRGIEINRSPIGENFPLPAFFPTSAFPSSFLLTSRFPSDTDIGERTHREWLRFNECLTTRSLHLGTKIMQNQQVCVFMFLYSYVFLCLVLYSIASIMRQLFIFVTDINIRITTWWWPDPVQTTLLGAADEVGKTWCLANQVSLCCLYQALVILIW